MAIQNDIQWDATDVAQLAAAEIPQSEATRQLRQLREGAPYAEIVAPAGSVKGIYRISIEEERQYLDLWEQYRQSRYASMLNFVPASCAASRMFKMLYPLLDQSEQESLTEEQQTFLDHIEAFAFAQQLNETSLRKLWMSVSKLLEMGRRKELIELLLTDKGMNYGSTPKGMILFHRYEHERRSAAAEHLVEGALYEKDRDGHVAIHFTVAPDELELFKSHVERYRQKFEDDFGVLFDITYSTQCRSTDTIAIDSTGEPFRNNDGSLLLRPGGHGSLLKNLNEQDAEVHRRLLRAREERHIENFAEDCAVKPQLRPSRQQLAAAQARIDPEAEAGDVLRNDRRGGSPGDGPAEDQHEEQVQPDVQ